MLEVWAVKYEADGGIKVFRMLPTRVDDEFIYFDKNKIPRNGLDHRVFDDFDEVAVSVESSLKRRLATLKEQIVKTEQSILRVKRFSEDDVPIKMPSGNGKV